jgi:hypothetical protein
MAAAFRSAPDRENTAKTFQRYSVRERDYYHNTVNGQIAGRQDVEIIQGPEDTVTQIQTE